MIWLYGLLEEIMSNIEYNLKIEDEDYFYDKLPLFTITTIGNENKKIQWMDKHNIDDLQKLAIIESIKDEDKKVELLDKFSDESQRFKFMIVEGLQDEEKKIQAINKFSESYYKEKIIRTIQDEEKKIQAIDKITDENIKAKIILSIKEDEKKIELLDKITDDYFKAQIIKSIKYDENRINLLDRINDENFKAEIIKEIKDEDKKIELLDAITSEYAKAAIIKSLEYDENKIELLDRITDQTAKAEIIREIKDEDKKIELLDTITSEYAQAAIIKSIENDEKKIELLEKITNEVVKAEIIKEIKDEDKKIELLDTITSEYAQAEIIKSLEYDENKVELLVIIANEDYKAKIIETIIDEDKKIEAINQLSDDILICKTLETIQDRKKIKNAIENLQKDEMLKAYFESEKLQNNFENLENNEQKYKSINLPQEMTIGMEIEAEGKYSSFLPNEIGNWEKKKDGSLDKDIGIEVISPIMHDTDKDVSEIYKITTAMKNMQIATSERCGGHIHIGADYIKSPEGFQELLELWGNAEEVYFLISNQEGELPREGLSEYASPISKKYEDSKLPIEEKQDAFIEDAKKIQGSRYSSINLLNINNGKNTIEFRLSNGTIDPNIWIENIRLYGRTVQVAQELAEIKEKITSGKELTKEEQNKYRLKQALKMEMPTDEKMKALITILFDEKEREVYEQRYMANKELESKDHRLEEVKTKFGRVDFEEIYKETEIPRDIINNLNSREENEQENARQQEDFEYGD